jgi:MFS family permease
MVITQLLLAQSGGSSGDSSGSNPLAAFNDAIRQHPDLFNQPEAYAPVLQATPMLWALGFIVLGAVCVLYGYRWNKLVITALAALAGVWAGLSIGDHFGDQYIVAACLAILLGVLAWPLLRFSVSLFGGVVGAFAGANLFTAFFTGLQSAGYTIDGQVAQLREMPYIGAFIGLIVVGMLAFMAFRAVMILLTTVVGASLLISGALAALMSNQNWSASITQGMSDKPLIVPVVVAVTAIIGAAVQLSGGIKGLAAQANKADPKAAKPAKA